MPVSTQFVGTLKLAVTRCLGVCVYTVCGYVETSCDQVFRCLCVHSFGVC